MSQAIRKTPAEVIGVFCGIRAYSLNRAVWLFGSTLQSQLDEIDSKEKKSSTARAKKQMLLATWLAEPGRKGLFKDPAASG